MAYFNRSFIDTARIDVLLAKTFSEPTVPKAMREKCRLRAQNLLEKEQRLLHEQEEQQQRKRQRPEHKSNLDAEIAANPKLKEFIETFKPSAQVQSWKNDTYADGLGAPSTKALDEALVQHDGASTRARDLEDYAVAADASSDDDYDVFQKDASSDEEMIPLTDHAPERDAPGAEDASSRSVADKEPLEAAESASKAGMSDLEWLQQKRVRMKQNESGDGQTASTQPTTPLKRSKLLYAARRPLPAEDPEEAIVRQITQTGRLFIRNILYDATEEEFRELFGGFGELSEVHIAVDTRTGQSKGYVYVQFSHAQDAVSAYRAMDKQIFQGRLLHVLPGAAKKDHRLDEFALRNLPLKKQRELHKKVQAGKTQFSWNALFLNSDAVLDTVALKMGVSKAQLLDPQSASAAVKQALAEAHVLGDVRKYFEEHGVDLTTFAGSERDDRVILVKNLAFGTTSAELAELFAAHGELKRVLVAPAGTIAIVEFRDAPSARSAFAKLAYRMYKKTILYLEKGPRGLFKREPRVDETADASSKDPGASADAVLAKVSAHDFIDDTDAGDDDGAESGPTVSVFVKNLNFATTSAQLADAFRNLPGFVVALVKTKPDPRDAQKTLSMGFGFVEFRTRDHAEAAISAMDNQVLDGHRVQLKRSHRKSCASSRAKSDRTNKIIIKNLPFEVTRKDVLELFGTYGQVRSVRVPKKFDKSARGFAFVEYTLVSEAQDAMNQLQGVHMLGRRLVMQYAEQASENAEDEIAKMTEKARKQAASRDFASARALGRGKVQLEEEDPFQAA